MTLRTFYETCTPRPEVLAGDLPDAIFAADLWNVIVGRAHPDYGNPQRFFASSHPTENLAFLLREIGARLAGRDGRIPVFRLETGFGGGKTHSLIAATHLAREGSRLSGLLADYGISDLPPPGVARVAAFVGEQSDPLTGIAHEDFGGVRTYTPWGEIAIQLGGMAGYELVRENDTQGVAPSRQALDRVLGEKPTLILIDELVLFLARCVALPEGHPRHQVAGQMPTFLQTLFALASNRPATSIVFTLPSEQDANRRVTAELKQYVPEVLEAVGEMERTANRQARNLTPTQPGERAAVIGRRLFQAIDKSSAPDVAEAYRAYYEQEQSHGADLERWAFERSYLEQIEKSYPFHPELITLFAERLADIPEFQATRGALRLVARTIRSAWNNRERYPGALLFHPHHIDLTRPEVRDEILARLSRTAYGPALEVDVVAPGKMTHASQVESGWPFPAATEAAITVFLHSLPDSSRGLAASEVAVAVGRPGCDLAYVKRGLEETEARAWYMRREGERFLFRTRASVNKRFQERAGQVGAGEIREQLDTWVEEIYSGFDAFQVLPFPADHTAIPDAADRLRLVIVHYDKEGGSVGGGDRLSFTRDLFTRTGVNASPRVYRNNLIFLLAESTRIQTLKEHVRALIAWERVRKDLEDEQRSVASAHGSDYRTDKEAARRGGTGVPVEFMALENDMGTAMEKLGTQEINVRSRILEAFRVLAFPLGASAAQYGLWDSSADAGPGLECFRIDFGETSPATSPRRGARVRDAVAEAPILEALRGQGKLVPEAAVDNPVVLAPQVVRQRPAWSPDERRISTQDVWDRFRRNPDLPMLLRQTDLLPTLRAGLTTVPEALWSYYDQGSKRVYTRESASSVAPVLSATHFLYDLGAAFEDRIIPVTSVAPSEIWDYLWPREAVERLPKCPTRRLTEGAIESLHFPVLPERQVLWDAVQQGVRERRWILFLTERNLAIGADELDEWPATPAFDDGTELWQYEAALSARIYPRTTGPGPRSTDELTPNRLIERCWASGRDRMVTEDIERVAREFWPDLSRPRLERVIREGVEAGTWGTWRQGARGAYYTDGDPLPEAGLVGSSVVLVRPTSDLAQRLDVLRPGRGPQPVEEAGTPREALTRARDRLSAFEGLRIAELSLTVLDRDSLENTLAVTWADRPLNAVAHVDLTAEGERSEREKIERVQLSFDGQFETVRPILAPIWPFRSQDKFSLSLTLQFVFEPAIPLDDPALVTYETALMNANQGRLELRVVPSRDAVEVS